MSKIYKYLTEGMKGKDSYKILKAKVTGTKDGEDLPQKYRVVMYFRDGHWMIAPEQSFDGKFTNDSGLAGWSLKNFVGKNAPKEIWIDMGQKWGLKGLDGAVKEALKNI